MELDNEKLELINNKIEKLYEKFENDELTQWESVLLDTLLWIKEDDQDVPTFFY